jgi:hypothetical protein
VTSTAPSASIHFQAKATTIAGVTMAGTQAVHPAHLESPHVPIRMSAVLTLAMWMLLA